MPRSPSGRSSAHAGEKKTAETIQQEIHREVGQLLRRLFGQREKTEGLDLEAIEMALRSAMHQMGANALSQLLEFDAPSADQRERPCACGHRAKYLGLRSKTVLTAVGEAITSAKAVIKGSSQWMWILISRTPSYRPACAAC